MMFLDQIEHLHLHYQIKLSKHKTSIAFSSNANDKNSIVLTSRNFLTLMLKTSFISISNCVNRRISNLRSVGSSSASGISHNVSRSGRFILENY